MIFENKTDNNLPFPKNFGSSKFGQYNELPTDQIKALVSPRKNTMVYNTDLDAICYFNGTIWKVLSSMNL